jgi:hypothetical protein
VILTSIDHSVPKTILPVIKKWQHTKGAGLHQLLLAINSFVPLAFSFFDQVERNL